MKAKRRQDRVLGVLGVPSARARRARTFQLTHLVHKAFVQVVCQHGSSQNALALPPYSRDVHATGVQLRPARPAAEQPTCDTGVVAADGLEPALEAMIAVGEALARLAQTDARPRQVAELTFAAGVENEERTALRGVSPTTVKRDWKRARGVVRGVVAEAP